MRCGVYAAPSADSTDGSSRFDGGCSPDRRWAWRRGIDGRGRLARCHAAARPSGVASSASRLAVGSGGSTSTVVTSRGTRRGFSAGCIVLQSASYFEETGGEPPTLGVQLVQTACQVEVREVSEELLLLETVSECQLAHRAQARMLQAG